MRLNITFYECEHGGDVDHYEADLRRAGATIVDSDLNSEAESCTIQVEVADKYTFLDSFKLTDAFGFSDWC
jgi:hypothetical protein